MVKGPMLYETAKPIALHQSSLSNPKTTGASNKVLLSVAILGLVVPYTDSGYRSKRDLTSPKVVTLIHPTQTRSC